MFRLGFGVVCDVVNFPASDQQFQICNRHLVQDLVSASGLCAAIVHIGYILCSLSFLALVQGLCFGEGISLGSE